MIINWGGVMAQVVPYYRDQKHKQIKLVFLENNECGQPTGETVEILLPWKPANDIGNWLIELSQKAREEES